MITPKSSWAEIQAAIDAGGTVEFAPGFYEDAHYKITKPVHLIGYGAVLTGGRRIKWSEESEDILSFDVSSEKPLRELVVGGKLRPRCRLPESGYWQHETDYPYRWLGTSKGGWEVKPTFDQMVTMQVKAGALDSLTLHSAEATIVHSWSDSLLPIARADGDTIVFGEKGDMPVGGFGIRDYCLWNVPEAFQKPGTFYHDTKAGKLYYRPLPGENIDTEAYLPTHSSIFHSDIPVEKVEMEGFELMVTSAPRVKAGFGAYGLSGAIDFPELSDSRLHHLTIHAVGGYGIRMNGCARNILIDHCEIFDTGAGGIRLAAKPDGAKSEIADCYIHHTGVYQPSAIGLSAVNCHIRHNEVCHTSYSAINCGGNDFVVEKNLLHDTMEVLNDGAAIYSFGSQNGVMRENLACGIQSTDGHSLRIAYYLDELSKNWLVERNVAVDCDFPNHNHMCGMHTYRENLFVNETGAMKISLQRVNTPSSYIGNVFSAGKEIVFSMTKDALSEVEENRYHSKDGTIVSRLYDEDGNLTETPLSMNKSNRPINAVHFNGDARIFEAADLQIDLTDVGPRH